MICIALSSKNINTCIDWLDKVEMAEIRLDLTAFGPEEIKRVFSHKTPAIATCRPEKLGTDKQFEMLSRAIEAGAHYVDIEYEAPKDQVENIRRIAMKNRCKLIVSYHNFVETPGLRELYKIADECYAKGADIAKIATHVLSDEDNARLLSLYSISKPLIALGMGDKGKISRLMAPFLGAVFTFAAMDEGNATAPGQINYSRMKKTLGEILDSWSMAFV